MFKNHIRNKSGQPSPSPQSAPLLAAAQGPGISSDANRYSELSADSNYSTPLRSTTPTASGYNSPMSPSPTPITQRYGPTANVSPASSTMEHMSSNKAAGAPIPTSMLLDDDGLDDNLHTFGPNEKKDLDSPFNINSWRGWMNAAALFVLFGGLVTLFAGYPIIDWYYANNNSVGGAESGYNLGGVNGSGQYPEIPGFPRLIDPDTPQSAYTRKGTDGNEWNLVFSDEFEKDGRTFWPGDDPFFTAVDFHYWATNDLEWYTPEQITTKDGKLVITVEQMPMNNLMYRSGMLQTWNQLCFNKNAYFEVKALLPGQPDIAGFWPGIWTMGNLGRPGYGATTEGLWPYSYSACDVGVFPNQTFFNGTPATNEKGGDPRWNDGDLSYLPGQRLTSCQCPGSGFHPGPEGVGRGAVEIDMIEAAIDISKGWGTVSQSAQVAPFDYLFAWNNDSESVTVYDDGITRLNDYRGGVFQEAVSAVSYTCTDCKKNPGQYYRDDGGEYALYGFEYVANIKDRSKGYIEWYNVGKPAWRMEARAMGPNKYTEIEQRLISEEPMSMIFNLGLSNGFQVVDANHLNFPNQMLIEYIRVYQLPGTDASVGCDPEDRPTADYIDKYRIAYDNPNLTMWKDTGFDWPLNRAVNPDCKPRTTST